MSELYLEIKAVKLEYGLRTILDIDHLEIRAGEKIGLVGANGAGKTTFLKLLAGEILPDEGQIRRLKPLSYIRQLDDGASASVEDRRLAAAFRAQPDREGLSGGEQTRRRIAQALSAHGHILLADEPTTDLDSEGVQQLEKHLSALDGALLLVSHDRQLLDSLVTQIWELENARVTVFPGNYESYRREKERRREFARFEYRQYREEQARLRAAIQGKREHASQVGRLPSRMGNSEARLHKRSATETEEKLHKTRKALESRLAHLEEKERPQEDPAIAMALGAHLPIKAKNALEARLLTLKIGDRVLLKNASFALPTGSRTALIGPNGCGKTTLIRHIVSRGGALRINPAASIGYFGQDHTSVLDTTRTALENVMAESVQSESVVRTVLARLNLRGEDVFKPVGVLSGGERAKVALARLFVGQSNLLILDEPTNHLDIFSLEALADVLGQYRGTLLLVSHDRRFLQQVATRHLRFEGNSLVSFEGDMAAWQSAQSANRAEEDRRLRRTALEMRMAVLAARLASPAKGDDPAQLNAEYMSLAKELRAMH